MLYNLALQTVNSDVYTLAWHRKAPISQTVRLRFPPNCIGPFKKYGLCGGGERGSITSKQKRKGEMVGQTYLYVHSVKKLHDFSNREHSSFWPVAFCCFEPSRAYEGIFY